MYAYYFHNWMCAIAIVCDIKLMMVMMMMMMMMMIMMMMMMMIIMRTTMIVMVIVLMLQLGQPGRVLRTHPCSAWMP